MIVYFREVRGINLKIVSLTFPKTLPRSESSPKAEEPSGQLCHNWEKILTKIPRFLLPGPSVSTCHLKIEKNAISFAGPLAHVFPK